MSNPEEITTMIETVLAKVVGLLTTYGMDVLGAVVMLIAGVWLSGRVGVAVKKGMDKTEWMDPTLTSFSPLLLSTLCSPSPSLPCSINSASKPRRWWPSLVQRALQLDWLYKALFAILQRV